MQTRYRGDAGQGLAAKTHAADLFEILQRGDLAGGMARQCELQLTGRYTDPVVSDADAPLAALLDIHLDGRRPGVDTVFQQLLDDGGRPFDDLARGYLVDEL